MTTRGIRALIVEDEPQAREAIRTWLNRLPGVELIGECSRGEAAANAVRALAPDVVLEQTADQPSNNELIGELRDILHRAAQRGKKPLGRLLVKQGTGRVLVIRTEDIDWVEAAGNYVKLHIGKDEYLLRGRITAIEAGLDSSQFVRIHRSTLVNVDRIQELQPWFHGDYVAILRNGTQLSVSRNYRSRVLGLCDADDV